MRRRRETPYNPSTMTTGSPASSARTLAAAAAVLLLATSAGATVRYWAFGDSITAGEGFDGCDCVAPICGYSWRLQSALQAAGVDAKVDNLGVGGENTAEGLARLQHRLSRPADVLLLMEGTNDIKKNGLSPETTLFNLGEMGRMAEEKGMEVVHMTLLPRWPSATWDWDNTRTRSRSRDVRDLAAGEGRQLVDPFQIFGSIPHVFDDYYSDCIPEDPVGHPNPAGFEILSAAVFDVLTARDEVPPVIAATDPKTGAEEVPGLGLIQVRLVDLLSGVDLAATHLEVQGATVGTTAVVDGGVVDGGVVDLTYRPTVALSGPVEVWVEAADLAGNTMRELATSFTADASVPGTCEPALTVLCIDDRPGDRRFQVTLDWYTAQNGGQSGMAIPLQLDVLGVRRGGLFSFFNANNPEVLIKVLNGCNQNGFFWVYSSPTTTLGLVLTVVDTVAAQNGASLEQYQYVITNADGVSAAAVSDTQAFDTCGFNVAP